MSKFWNLKLYENISLYNSLLATFQNYRFDFKRKKNCFRPQFIQPSEEISIFFFVGSRVKKKLWCTLNKFQTVSLSNNCLMGLHVFFAVYIHVLLLHCIWLLHIFSFIKDLQLYWSQEHVSTYPTIHSINNYQVIFSLFILTAF